AFLGNALILIALRNVSSLYPPTKLLFQCLAMTDFGVGLTLQPFYAIHVLYSAINVNWDIFLFFRYKLGFVNLSLWSFPVHKDYSKCGLTSRPFIEAKVKARRNTKASSCSYFLLLQQIIRRASTISVSVMLCIVTSLLSYTIIFIKLRLHQATVHPTVHPTGQCDVHHHGQPIGGGIPALRIAQFKRTVTSIGLVQSALVVCYIPFVIVNAMLLLNNVLANLEVSFIASLVYPTLVFLNSSLNPFLYCWRIKEVRQAVKATIKQLYCNCLR
ncbi:unnamed protein product, partial [Porites lobata]